MGFLLRSFLQIWFLGIFSCYSSDASSPSGLVAAYGFDEGQGSLVFDLSGNGHGGTIAGATWAAGKYGTALLFNGVNALVRVANSSALQLQTNMTLEAWVNPIRVGSGWEDVIYKANDAYYLESSSSSDTPAAGGTFSTAPLFSPNPLSTRSWTHLAATYDGSKLRLYANGTEVAQRSQSGLIHSSRDPLTIGGDDVYGQFFAGLIDEVRIYNRALSTSEIQADMITPVSNLPPDNSPPTVSITAPEPGQNVFAVAKLAVAAADDQLLAAVEWWLDGDSIGAAFAQPYVLYWDSNVASNGLHQLTAVAMDGAGNRATSAPVTVSIKNPGFANETVVPDIVSATTMAFLPDGRMLVGELSERVWIVQPGANQPESTAALTLDGSALVDEQGLMDIAIDPAFLQNHYIYLFYTHASTDSENRNRVSRFTLDGNRVSPASEFVLWEDNIVASDEHHGGALAFGQDGKLYFTVGDQFSPDDAQQLDSYHGKLLRINSDGSIPEDNPFFDADGPNLDEIWALGLRNPYRMSVDLLTGRIFIGDVGGNDNSTSVEEINIAVRGANYGWPLCEGNCGNSDVTDPLFSYPHSGRDACVTAGFVYRGSQFPREYQGNFFFADYVQNWIKRLILDTNGNVIDVVNFEPVDGSKDGPYGDPVKLAEAPDGSLYYVDLGFNDAHVPNEAAIRRIRYVGSNLPPVAAITASPVSGMAPLSVTFSSIGSYDPDGAPLTYEWDFGDGTSSPLANPTHSYFSEGQFRARLKLSDGVNSTLSSNIVITAGGRPTATIVTPQDGVSFRAGDTIVYSGVATDPEDGELAAKAFSWAILFHHEGHIHPGTVTANTQTGTLVIPIAGHDFQGSTSYEIVLTVTDSDGLKSSDSVTVFPEKVNLSFETVPGGLSLEVAGILRTTPFTIDAMIGFQYQVNAPTQFQAEVPYGFVSWSDGGLASHGITVPDYDETLIASYESPGKLTIDAPIQGVVRLRFTGTTGRVYRIEGAPDLLNWQTIGTAAEVSEGMFEFQDAVVGRRFYRCVTP